MADHNIWRVDFCLIGNVAAIISAVDFHSASHNEQSPMGAITAYLVDYEQHNTPEAKGPAWVRFGAWGYVRDVAAKTRIADPIGLPHQRRNELIPEFLSHSVPINGFHQELSVG